MEKDKFFVNVSSSPLLPNWQSPSSGTDIRLGNMNCVPEQLQSGFLNLNWETAPFEPALSSIVSSPVTVTTSYSTTTSCYNTPLNSPPKLNLSTIPGNSMTAPSSLAPFSTDPGFAERAAKFSCFGNGNYGGPTAQLGFHDAELLHRSVLKMGSGKLSRVSSVQSFKTGSEVGVLDNKETGLPDGLEAEMRSISPSALDRKFSRLSRSSTPDDAEFGNAHEESSPSDLIAGGDVGLNGPIEINARKRKAVPRGKLKEFPSSPSAKDPKAVEENDSNAKRSKSTEANAAGKDSAKQNAEQNGIPNAADGSQKQTKDNIKPPEPPKQDYIHVRARRGQATDSHSLAERVRREKISERMKFLQDLVPGCNKVTGKAVMLDEIINYVQSLQRQVEFLSMKLANVNPRLDLNMETLLSKNILQSHGPLPNSTHTFDSSAPAFLFGQQPQQGPMLSITSNGSEAHGSVNPLDLHRNLGSQLPTIDGCGDTSSQLANFWDDDLQSVVQMGFGQNQETAFPFHGSLPTTHMKVEL